MEEVTSDFIKEMKSWDDYYKSMNEHNATTESTKKREELFKRDVKVYDPVNHPAHYTSHPSGVECIDIAKWYDFCIGNTIKYIWRAGLKRSSSLSDKEKELEDLKKARWYLDKEIQEKEKELHAEN